MAGSWRSEPLPSNWPSIRYAVLERDPVCRWGSLPGEEGRCGLASTDADHTGDPGNHDPAFLRGLCTWHHRHRTALQGVAARLARPDLRKRPKENHPAYRRDL